MTYQEAVSYIEGIGKFSIREPLKHTQALLDLVGNPQDELQVIHVAGTNGKGSVCAYLASMLREGGFTCGLFTSPHLVVMNERIRLNDEMISNEDFLHCFQTVKAQIPGLMEAGWEHPSYFEILCVMAMLYYKERGADYVILETGLGGKLDATNTVKQPLASVITSIGLDHTEILGDTIQKIAAEKAGIIKPGVPVFYDASKTEAAEVIAETAKRLGCVSHAVTPAMVSLLEHSQNGIRFLFDSAEEITIPYVARYQMMNAALAYAVMKELRQAHKIPNEILKNGICQTKWEGRMETILPGVIVDGAHNEDGIERFIETARYFKQKHRVTILFSAVADKRYREMIRRICEKITPDAVIATQIEGERIVAAGELAAEFVKNGCVDVSTEADIEKAFARALEKRQDGMLFCVGSLYLVGEIKKCLRSRAND